MGMVVEDRLINDQYLVLEVVDENTVDDEILGEICLEDAEYGQVDMNGLDVKTCLLDLDVQHTNDVLH